VRIVTGASVAPAGWALLRPSACPCCVGRVQLQVELVRLMREGRPRGVAIELADASHLPPLRRALGEWPLAQYVVLEADL
jgi:hypothetical protein